MYRFLARRISTMVISLLGATIVVFGLAHAKDDPINVFIRAEGYAIGPEQIAALRAKWGLDKPIVLQYATWLGNLLRADLGRSVGTNRKVTDILRERWPATMQLAIGAWIVGTFVGIPLGNSLGNASGFNPGLFSQGVCTFRSVRAGVLGRDRRDLGLCCLFGMVARTNVLWTDGREFLRTIPVLGHAGACTRLGADRGLSAYHEICHVGGAGFGVHQTCSGQRHGVQPRGGQTRFPQRVDPAVNGFSVTPSRIHGRFGVGRERICLPGVGQIAVAAVNDNDFTLLTGIILLFTILFLAMSFISDLLYVVIDPRIRLD